MADFQVKKLQMFMDITTLQFKGNSLVSNNTSIVSDDVSTLKTSMEIIAQHDEIIALLEMYKALIDKDAGDIRGFVREAERMDNSIASNHNAR